MKHRFDTQFFPGWTRKCVTFTIDDGNVEMDRKFLDIVRPAGIRGTFNLCSHLTNQMTPNGYRQLYAGYEIANHCKYHPFACQDYMNYVVSDHSCEPGKDPVSLSPDGKTEVLYPLPQDVVGRLGKNAEGMYHVLLGRGLRLLATPERYVECIRQCHDELEEIFGKGSVRSFAWPFDRQKCEVVEKYLAAMPYYGVRGSGKWGAEESFAMPPKRTYWKMTAYSTDLLEKAAAYVAQPDDGTLKFFCFGAHSIDYENRWHQLREFADTFGNRPKEYYSATVGEIFDYEDAVKALVIEQDSIYNPSGLDVYLKVDGEPVLLKAGEKRYL